MMHCPFCDEKINEAVFAESENFRAIYNIAPIFPGHSLIIPKQHIQSADDLSDGSLTEMTLFARKVTRLLMRVFNAEAYNWSLQDKEAAGQTLAHLHWHIVLRFLGDLPEPGDWYPRVKQNYSEILDSKSRARLSSEDMKSITAKLRREALNSK